MLQTVLVLRRDQFRWPIVSVSGRFSTKFFLAMGTDVEVVSKKLSRLSFIACGSCIACFGYHMRIFALPQIGDCPMFRRFYVQKVLCSENICTKGSMFRRFYYQKVLCSEGSMFRRSYIQKVLYSEGPIFRRSYVQKVLCSEKNCSKGPIFRRFYVQKVLYSDIFRRSYIQKILSFM